jgi:hypothetical protein
MKKIISFWFIFLLAIVSAEAAKGPRKYYLSQERVTGSQALTACADGFHMASLWEIFQTTLLKYDTTRGLTFSDSGYGPPTGFGWIRTGYVNNGQASVPGQDNCLTWTSAANSDFGTITRPSFTWNAPATTTDPWESSVATCDGELGVWCVED